MKSGRLYGEIYAKSSIRGAMDFYLNYTNTK